MARGIFTLKQQLQGIREKSWTTPSAYSGLFNGASQTLTITTGTTTTIPSGNDLYTIEAWVNPTYLANQYHPIIGWGTFGTTKAVNAVKIEYISSTETRITNYWWGSDLSSSNCFSLGLMVGNWTHVACTFDGTTRRIFCNGNLVASDTPTGHNVTNVNPVIIGGDNTAYFTGYISNMRVVKGVAVYTANFTPPTGPLTAINGTSILTLQNSTFIDNSSNAFAFTNNNTVTTAIVTPFRALQTPAVDYLVVAGGGGGGSEAGGGAGGLLQGSVPVATGSAITVTVGSGGAAATNGQNSVFGSIAATGGGGAVDASATGANSGGSGAGGGSVSSTKGQGTFGQGNAGGAGANINSAGGGGGAGTAGLPAISGVGGNGGAGISSAISGTLTAYAGGGGGSGYTGTQGIGGVGGGAAGVYLATANTGTPNTGGGGGGRWGSPGGAGGSGIVIVSYPDIYAAAAATTGSPVVSTSGSGSIGFGLSGKNDSTQENSYLNITGVPNLTGDFTVEFWYYLTGTTGYQALISNYTTSTTTTCLYITTGNNSSGISCGIGNGSTEVNLFNASSLVRNTWYHVAISRSGSTVRGYVNGTLNGTATSSASITGSPYALGSYPGNYAGIYPLQGYISNVRIVNGTALYTSNFTPSTIPLTPISGTVLLINTVSGAPFIDGSSNNSSVIRSSGTGGAGLSLPAWNQASPFATGLGYKNRVYTYNSSGTITF